MKFDKEHKESLEKYLDMREKLQSHLEHGEKITPKKWRAEIKSLQEEYDRISREQALTAKELAYAEVISYNKKNLERELRNESRQQNRATVNRKKIWDWIKAGKGELTENIDIATIKKSYWTGSTA